ncbi:MAG: 3-hydroxyacyl-CoA dehydrogenase, partial [Actinobacteria bacterium]|nr:3-hydroxyacyl-CoA dehydrogenase [Actinomycetota bacterium]
MAEFTKPDGAPDEVVTKAFHREVDLSLFGFSGTLSLITLDNGLDHTRPNTLGPQSLQEIDSAITIAEGSGSSAIA